MSPGRKPATNRAHSRRFTAGTPAEKVAFLRGRLERLIRALHLFAGHCDLAPPPFRSAVRQFIDLAEIELREGLKALPSSVDDPALTTATACLTSTVVFEEAPAPSAPEEPLPAIESCESGAAHALLETVEPSIDPLLSDSAPQLNSLGLSFDSMAQMAEVPEANDLEAILARLKSYSEALDSADVEGRKTDTSPGRDARELLLGFEVCRMDSETAEAAVEPANAGQTSAPIGEPSTDLSLAVSGDGYPSSPPAAPVGQSVPEATVTTQPVSLETAETQHSAEECLHQNLDTAAEEDSASRENLVQQDTPPAKREPDSAARSNPNTARGSKSEQAENSNPVNSISPENLLEINALKEELLAMMPRFKPPGAVSSDA